MDKTNPDSVGNQGALMGRVSLSQYTVVFVFVTLRFYTRGLIVRKFGYDDLFIGIATLLATGQTATVLLQIQNAQGQRVTKDGMDQFHRMLMWKWVDLLVYFLANWAVKMSILAMYYRIGSGKRVVPWVVQSRAVWVAASLITAFTVASFFAQLFACTPIAEWWDPREEPRKCIDVVAFTEASAAINVATDLMMLAFPIPLLAMLKFDTKQRTALGLILAIGIIPVVASTMRLCQIVMSRHPEQLGPEQQWDDTDPNWTWAWVPVWSQIEVDCGIMAASLPSLNPFFQKFCALFHASSGQNSTPQVPKLAEYRESWSSEDTSTDDYLYKDKIFVSVEAPVYPMKSQEDVERAESVEYPVRDQVSSTKADYQSRRI